MSHFVHAPEALLGRNDSKNPATTCKGITTSGRPCRRSLPLKALTSSAGRMDSALDGVVAVVQQDGEIREADFFCWQHKDQAEQAAKQAFGEKNGRLNRRPTQIIPLRERSSIDTLFQRLGVADTGSDIGPRPRQTRGPHRTRPDEELRSDRNHYEEKRQLRTPSKSQSKQKNPGFWASLCCIQEEGDDEYLEIVRRRRRTTSSRPAESAPNQPRVSRSCPSSAPANHALSTPSQRSAPIQPCRTKQHRTSSNSQTQQLLTLIPQHLPPQTTSALLAELIKPISPHDEDGYIYIFWLTPQNNTSPPSSVARSLLSPSRPCHLDRRISDVLTEFSYNGTEPEPSKKQTIRLKIGRANNVTRRMNEWQRQCGYALNLVRWYPYVPSASSSTPSSPQPSPLRQGNQQSLYPDLSRHSAQNASPRRDSEGVRKVPFVKRVERLIHLELAEQQLKSRCDACGKEHREWFEVAASQAGVREVDACVRRWVEWAEKQAERESRRDSGAAVPYC